MERLIPYQLALLDISLHSDIVRWKHVELPFSQCEQTIAASTRPTYQAAIVYQRRYVSICSYAFAH